jgi:hypothetical protein
MPSRYYDKAVLKAAELPPSRQDFLASIAEPEGLETARIEVLHIMGNGVPDRAKPIMTLDMLRIQGLQLPQEERFQPVVDSSGDGQAYFFGRNVRVYQVSAYMIDTNLDRGQEEASAGLSGHLLTKWKQTYEEIRASSLVRARRILRMVWHKSESLGYILSQVASLDAGQPNVCQIGLAFMSVCDLNYAPPKINIMAQSFDGLLTLPGATRLFPELVGAPTQAVGASVALRMSVPPVW